MTTAVETNAEILPASWVELATHASGTPITVARVILVAGLLAAPLAFGAVAAWAWAGLTMLAAATFILWGMEQISHKRVRIARSPLLLPAVVFVFLSGIQFCAGLSLDRIAAREAFIKLATDFLLFFLAMHLFTGAPRSVWRGFVAAVTVFMFGLSLLAILQYFTSGSLIYWIHETTSGYAFGPYANQNHYAGLMELLIPISVAGMLGRREGHPSRLFWGFATVVALASVLLTGSRGGLIALMAEIAILGMILLRCTPPRRARARWAAVGLGVAASATLFLIIDPGQVSARLATVAEIPTKPEVTLAERRLASRDAMRLFQDHPWGVGLGSFAVAFPQYQSLATDLLWNHAHNDYVEALAETGVAGGFLIVLALVMFLPLAFGRLRERLEHEVGWIQVGAAIGCCGLLAHSLGDFNLHVPANAAWFAVSAALAAQPTIVDRPNDTPCDSR